MTVDELVRRLAPGLRAARRAGNAPAAGPPSASTIVVTPPVAGRGSGSVRPPRLTIATGEPEGQQHGEQPLDPADDLEATPLVQAPGWVVRLNAQAHRVVTLLAR